MGSPLGSLLGSPSTMDSPSGRPLYRAIEGKMVGLGAYLVERGKWKEKENCLFRFSPLGADWR